MFSDIHSVRSVPTSSSKKQPYNRAIPVPSLYSPSENSPVQSHVRSHWRNNLHPQIEEQYNRIIRGENLRCNPNAEKPQHPESTRKSQSASQLRKQYEERVKQLQEQNHSLREQLYYLREALLINFSQRQQSK